MSKTGLLKDIEAVILDKESNSMLLVTNKDEFAAFLNGRFDSILSSPRTQLTELKVGLAHATETNTPELQTYLKGITDNLFSNQSFNEQMKPYAEQIAPILLLNQPSLFKKIAGSSLLIDNTEDFVQSLKVTLVAGKAKHLDRSTDLLAAKDEQGIMLYKIGKDVYHPTLSPATDRFQGMKDSDVTEWFKKNHSTIGNEDLATAMKYQYRDDLAVLMPKIKENFEPTKKKNTFQP